MEKYRDRRKNDDGKTVYFIKETSCCGHYVEWLRGQIPESCPYCGCRYYNKPNLEMKLFMLQDEWVKEYDKNGSMAILGERMFPIMQEYAVNIIKGMIKGKRSLSEEELQERAFDAATLLVEVILRDSDHKMKYSFGAYLGRLCKSVCYSTQNHERTFSLNSLLQDGETEFGETIIVNTAELTGGREEEVQEIRVNNRTEMKEVRDNAVEKVMKLINTSSNHLFVNTGSYEQKILYLLGLLLKFKNEGENTISDFFQVSGKLMKTYVERGELIIFETLREMSD